MNADRFLPRLVPAFILILALAWTLSACGPSATPTYFRPPSDFTPLPSTQSGATISNFVPTLSPLAFTSAPPTPTPPCTNDLTFLNDLTYTDGTVVLPGESMDKQWLVQNTGSCDWDARYHLRFVGGDLLGAEEELPLYPARAGARVTLRIVFTAPSEAGTYESQWQAVNPEGTFFGKPVYILITVASY